MECLTHDRSSSSSSLRARCLGARGRHDRALTQVVSPYGASDIGLDAVVLEVDLDADAGVPPRDLARRFVERRRILGGFGARVLEDEPSDVELDEVRSSGDRGFGPASVFSGATAAAGGRSPTRGGRMAQNHLRRLNFVDGPAREPRSFPDDATSDLPRSTRARSRGLPPGTGAAPRERHRCS
jgi:hypothetical protein